MLSDLNAALAGWPDAILSAVLIGIGAFLMLIGIFAPRILKVPVAVWAVL